MSSKLFSSDGLSNSYSRYEYLIIPSLMLLLQLFILPSSNGLFVETDNYAHALRLLDFIQSGSWKETLYRHDNCPFGQMLHFTRITDMFLYLTALPFLPFVELKKAIFFGGFLFNPVIACMTAAAFIWAGRAFHSAFFRFFCIFFYFSAGPVLSLFSAGRPDHHVLLNLFLILLSGSLIYGSKTQKAAYYKTAGIFAGLSIWISPEGFLASLFIFAGMVCAWLLKCQNMRQIRIFSQFLFITSLICLIVNPPMQGLFYPDNGRLSVLIVFILGLACSSFYAEEIIEKKYSFISTKKRFVSLSFFTLVSVVLVLSIFGKEAFLSSPIPPELHDIWTKTISELKPYIFSEMFLFFYLFLFGFFSCFCASLQIKKLLITFLFPFLMFLLLMFVVGRFSRPCMVFASIILLLSLGAMEKHIPFLRNKNNLIILSLLLLGIHANEIRSFYKEAIEKRKNEMIPAEYLPYIPQNKSCLLTLENDGPGIAWWTGRPVIGTNYHTNIQGIIDNHALLKGTDINLVIDLLKKRSISTILLNVAYLNEMRLKKEKRKIEATFIDENSFLNLLLTRKVRFCFLQQTELPDSIKEKYLIYNVDFNACSKDELK